MGQSLGDFNMIVLDLLKVPLENQIRQENNIIYTLKGPHNK